MRADSAGTESEQVVAYHALRDGKLTYQRCRDCGHCWLPERSECPGCLGDRIDRLDACGAAKLVSWVVYHHAFVPAFADLIPYTVGLVQLQEGPRLISNIVGVDDPEQLKIDQALTLQVTRRRSVDVPLFTPTTARDRNI